MEDRKAAGLKTDIDLTARMRNLLGEIADGVSEALVRAEQDERHASPATAIACATAAIRKTPSPDEKSFRAGEEGPRPRPARKVGFAGSKALAEG